MRLSETMLNSMLERQKQLNEEFLNMPIVKEELELDIQLPIPNQHQGISRTELFQCGETIELKRFIGSKLYKLKFTKGLNMTELINWLGTKDEIFMRCCR